MRDRLPTERAWYVEDVHGDETTRSAAQRSSRGLLVVSGTDVRTIPLPARGALTVGRDASCEIALDDVSLSRRHARITVEESACTVEDLGSRNGTRVKGAKLSGRPVALAYGDVVELGDTLLVLQAPPVGTSRRGLVVGGESRWFETLRGERVVLGRRGSLRLLLEALVGARLETPDRGLSLQAMFEAGWPGEKAHPTSAADRVYTAVQRLRALGLAGILLTRDDGYLLAADVPLERG